MHRSPNKGHRANSSSMFSHPWRSLRDLELKVSKKRLVMFAEIFGYSASTSFERMIRGIHAAFRT